MGSPDSSLLREDTRERPAPGAGTPPAHAAARGKWHHLGMDPRARRPRPAGPRVGVDRQRRHAGPRPALGGGAPRRWSDEAARGRPMLPERLSTDLTSLSRPARDRRQDGRRPRRGGDGVARVPCARAEPGEARLRLRRRLARRLRTGPRARRFAARHRRPAPSSSPGGRRHEGSTPPPRSPDPSRRRRRGPCSTATPWPTCDRTRRTRPRSCALPRGGTASSSWPRASASGCGSGAASTASTSATTSGWSWCTRTSNAASSTLPVRGPGRRG